MQALSSFPWISEFMQSQSQREKMACTKGHAIDMSFLNLGKRKRADSAASASSGEVAPVKKFKAESDQQTSHANGQIHVPQHGPASSHSPASKFKPVSQPSNRSTPSTVLKERSTDLARPTMSNTAQLQQAAEAQLNLEILLKHQELRLIEQELAKCQVSLEQLRRCQIIPFPGEDGSPLTAHHVRTGSGPALQPQRGYSHPPRPAPWGVTDGPYTQHYARWLIADPTFDSAPAQPVRSSLGGKSVSTRHSFADRGSLHSPRSQRGSVSSPLSATPNTYIQREPPAPSIVVRPSDGKKVRLVCKKCQKDDHRTIQGFLNHCRIAHGLEYKSHGAAAEDCGVAVDESELPPTPPVHEQAVPQSVPTLKSPSMGKPLVHPLIVGPRKIQHRTSSSVNSPVTPSPLHASFTQSSSEVVSVAADLPTVKQDANKSFVPSTQTPRLSALLSKRGVGADLDRAVSEARDRREYDEYMSLPDEKDDEVEEETKPTAAKGQAISAPSSKPVNKNQIKAEGGRVPTRTAAPSRLPLYSSNLNMETDNSHLASSGIQRQLPLTPEDDSDTHMDLSPHTIDTNPGLITDNDDDYDESVNHPSDESSVGEDLHVRVQDHDVMDIDGNGEGASAPEEPKLATPSRMRSNQLPQPSASVEPSADGTGEKRRRGRPSKRGGKP